MVSFKQITYALAVAKYKHFKSAAQSCHVSSSALSTAVSELESHLGLQIFERDNKKVLITPMGEEFLKLASGIKMQMDELQYLAGRMKGAMNYEMSIGLIPTIGPYLLPKVLPKVREVFPELKLNIVEEPSHLLVEMVRSGELDTAILATPYPLDGLHAFEFHAEDFYIITHKEAPYDSKTEISNEEVKKLKLLLLKEGHCLKDQALSVCKLAPENDAGKTYSLFGTSLYTLTQMVASGMGSTLVPHMALKQLLSSHEDLTAMHLSEKGPHRKIAFITRPNFTGVKDVEKLTNLFQECLKN